MKTVKLVLTVLLVLCLTPSVWAYTWNEIDLEATYGTGENEALVVLDFSLDQGDSFAWKVSFESADYNSILDVIAAADSGFVVEESYGYVIGISYTDASGTTYAGSTDWFSHFSMDLGQTWEYEYWHEDMADGDALGWACTADFSAPVTPLAPAVPIPGSLLLMGTGLLAVIRMRRR